MSDRTCIELKKIYTNPISEFRNGYRQVLRIKFFLCPIDNLCNAISGTLLTCIRAHVHKCTRHGTGKRCRNIFQASCGARLSSREITPRYRKYEPFDRPCRIESPLPSLERNPTRYIHPYAYVSAVCIRVCMYGVCGPTRMCARTRT